MKKNKIDLKTIPIRLLAQKMIGLVLGTGYFLILLVACNSISGPIEMEGIYDYEINFGDDAQEGILKVKEKEDSSFSLTLIFESDILDLENIKVDKNQISADIGFYGETLEFKSSFFKNGFKGKVSFDGEGFPIIGEKQSEELVEIDRSGFEYLLPEESISEIEKNIDHAGILENIYEGGFERGERIYNSNCINCHGTPEVEGSIPLSLRFWDQPFKTSGDLYSMYLTLTRGTGSMPPQTTLTPQEKYDVSFFIQKQYVRHDNEEHYIANTPGYRAGLPKGTDRGPEAKPYHPWKDMDYGNFFMNTYELVDEETGPERFHSPGPVPFVDEDYSINNFAYKGIAVRLDAGEGGVSDGKAWMMFDHDVMRVAGGWTGEGFIDWDGILLNDKHETYPRTIGKLHFETPVGPGWANPETGSFEDPRFRARDGRAFGPLPKDWADYKGLYHHGEKIIISYSVGDADILERFGMKKLGDDFVFTRTLDVSASNSILKTRIAKLGPKISVSGKGATLTEEDGFVMLNIEKSLATQVEVNITAAPHEVLEEFEEIPIKKESLAKYTKGGPSHYPEELTSIITYGKEDGPFAVDLLTPPFENPWDCRMKLSGIDFLQDANKAVACATDGDIWLISGLTEDTGVLKWKRIGAGLFQPLGIKILDEKIYVICRDQLVLLHDFNGDYETDFYESFNHDHQVTDHFHEFAMGLQADKEGNLYYAKSGRHAREALVPQHGTLLKVSKDGSTTEIVATGFRAANGVCINPDGSFIVTDQQGYWNPMNRINWVEIGTENKFYGNMWGYNPPEDESRDAMEPPMVWVDMEFDRSPSELLWVESEKWGPLNGSLLSFSYGYGKIQLVLNESVAGQRQGGVIDLPGIKFLTGVMRGRFNPDDGQLYACGMSAWGTSQLMRGGGLYRIRYTGNNLSLPINLKVLTSGLELSFATELNPEKANDTKNYEIATWGLVRSAEYGSERFDEANLKVTKAELQEDKKTVKLYVKNIKPIDVMTISYNIEDTQGNQMKGTVQNTIHNLGEEKTLQ